MELQHCSIKSWHTHACRCLGQTIDRSCESLYLKSLHRTTFSVSNKSNKGSAYLLRLAVKTTTSKRAPTSAIKRSMYGRLRTYTSTILSSISTGMMKSGLGTGLKEECTSVSSRSSTRHFLCLSCGAAGPITGAPEQVRSSVRHQQSTAHRAASTLFVTAWERQGKGE